MKSIVQEASSINKAIEQAWIKAGKPREFSVKVLEEAEKNFLGFTKKMAKIAFFFSDTMPRHDGRPQHASSNRYRRRRRRPRFANDQAKADNVNRSSSSPHGNAHHTPSSRSHSSSSSSESTRVPDYDQSSDDDTSNE